jgi:hypothetical protein
MSELISVILVLGVLAGQFQLISAATKDKSFKPVKKVFVGIYLIVGINFPVFAYFTYVSRGNQQIPIVARLLYIYLIGIFLIGVTTFFVDHYKVYKKKRQNLTNRSS